MSEKRVCFLIGAERSGTTLLRLMLDAHPRVAWCNEFEYVVERVGDDGEVPEVGEYVRWLKQDRIYKLHGWKIKEGVGYGEVVNDFLRQKREQTGVSKEVVGATVHRHYGRLLKLWPEARFIYLYRDGRDVAKSRIVQGWDGSMFTAVDAWVKAEKEWEVLRAGLPAERCMEVKYEEMVLETEKVLRGVCDFLGVGFDGKMFEYAERSTYGMPDPSCIYQWKRKQTAREIQLAEYKIGGMLEARGYELSGLPRLELDAAGERRVMREDRLGRIKGRVSRYGLWGTVLDAAARRLRIGCVEAYSSRRMERMINEQMK